MKRLIVIIFLIIIAGLTYTLFANKISRPNIPTPKPFHNLSYVGSIGTGKDKVEKGISSYKLPRPYGRGFNLFKPK